jgi:flagellar motor switch protein FliG
MDGRKIAGEVARLTNCSPQEVADILAELYKGAIAESLNAHQGGTA